MRILALDVGSTSVKAGLWEGRRFVARVREAYETEFDGARAEVPAGRILRAVERAGAAVLAGGKGIDAVAFCTLASAVIVTDGTGRPRTPVITHADRRSAGVARELVARRGKRWWLERTGNLPYPGGIGSSTLAWLRRNSPGVFRGVCRVGQVSSVVGWMLTGQWITDPSQAAFLGLWDIRRRDWSAEVCAAVGVALASLPEVRPADAVMGHLTGRVARRWGVKEGVPVLGGFVDTSAAVIQTPMHAGQLAHNAGSTDVLAMCEDRPRPAEGILTRPVGTRAGKWLVVRTIAASGSAVAWVRRTMFRELSDVAWERVAKRACQNARHAEDVVANPAFAGARAGIEQGSGASFTGMHLGSTREDLLAAIIRGLVVESAHGYDLLRGVHPPRRKVYVMGGAGRLGDAMHRAWQGRHVFERLTGDGLRGLVELAMNARG